MESQLSGNQRRAAVAKKERSDTGSYSEELVWAIGGSSSSTIKRDAIRAWGIGRRRSTLQNW